MSSPRRILIFSLAYYPSFVSGAEAAVKEITERIAPTDIEFHLITLLFDPSAPREERIGNVLVHRVGFGGAYLSKMLFVPLAALTARALDQKHHFDGIWAMMTYMLFPLVLTRILGVRAPHILTLQDGDPYEKVFERWFIRPFTPLLDYGFRTATVIQVISSYLSTWPPRRGYKGVIELVRNGANPNDLAQTVDPADVTAIHTRYNKQPGDIWLVNTARLVHQKAFDDTIRALVLLPTHIKLLVVGGGPEEGKLKALTEELQLTDRVFFAGAVDRTKVTAYRKAGDIFVGPSRSEGLGNAFLSAMSSELPVVATQEGGIADFLFDRERNPDKPSTGFAVDADSPEQIAAAVTYIGAHPDEVKQTLQNARAMVLENYTWDIVARTMRERVFAVVCVK